MARSRAERLTERPLFLRMTAETSSSCASCSLVRRTVTAALSAAFDGVVGCGVGISGYGSFVPYIPLSPLPLGRRNAAVVALKSVNYVGLAGNGCRGGFGMLSAPGTHHIRQHTRGYFNAEPYIVVMA